MFLKSFLLPSLGLLLAGGSLLRADAVAMPQTTFSGNITLTSSQFDDYFVYNANDGAVSGVKGVGITNPFTGQANFVPSGSFAVNESIQEYISTGYATAIGLYSPTGVSIAVNQDVYNKALNSQSWDQVFAGTAESTIVTALMSDDEATLQSFLTQYSTNFISFSSNNTDPISGGILHFSNASAGGSLTFNSITAVGGPAPVSDAAPEPSTQALLGMGFGLAAVAIRKFRKA